ncbi:MAG: hypothetical protein AAF658_14565, partial [Myxococcota bacterium]
LPQNRHLGGRKTDSVLQDNEEFYTSFGSAVKALAELYTNNREKLGALINSSPNAVAGGAVPSEAAKEQMRAIGQVSSLGLSVPTRVPGDS